MKKVEIQLGQMNTQGGLEKQLYLNENQDP